jgi:CRP-like cAMP-binding protein
MSLFAQGSKADAIYFVEDGLIKLTRTNAAGGRLILSLYGPDDLFGEESLAGGESSYYGEAELLSVSTVWKIPSATVKRVMATHPALGCALVRFLVDGKLSFAHKVEMLCLHDVETRILYYLGQLAKLVEPGEDDLGHALPITQLELADMLGATRETTSTTLNQLEKKGLVRLARRLLTIFPQRARAASATGGADI